MSPRSPVMAAISAALIVTAAGCGPLPIPPPDPMAGSVYRLEIEPCRGLSTRRATAFAVVPPESADPGQPARGEEAGPISGSGPVGPGGVVLVTAAHSLEHASGAMVRDERDGVRPASVMFLDPARDIAVLEIGASPDTGVGDAGFALTAPAPDSPVEVRTFADLEGPNIKAGIVTRLVDATLDGEGRRRAVELAAIDIDPGDSGAPVVNRDGEAVAMVFATARAGDRAWAVSALELRDAVATALDPAADQSELSCISKPPVGTEDG